MTSSVHTNACAICLVIVVLFFVGLVTVLYSFSIHSDDKHGREMVAPHWRSWIAVKSMFYTRLRNKNGTTRPATTAHDIKLGPLHSTINGCPFLREYDAATSPYLLFMSDQAIEALRVCEQWNLDGTFQSAPKIFKQIFTICGKP